MTDSPEEFVPQQPQQQESQAATQQPQVQTKPKKGIFGGFFGGKDKVSQQTPASEAVDTPQVDTQQPPKPAWLLRQEQQAQNAPISEVVKDQIRTAQEARKKVPQTQTATTEGSLPTTTEGQSRTPIPESPWVQRTKNPGGLPSAKVLGGAEVDQAFKAQKAKAAAARVGPLGEGYATPDLGGAPLLPVEQPAPIQTETAEIATLSIPPHAQDAPVFPQQQSLKEAA